MIADKVEHVMPRSWQTHWDEEPPLAAEEAAARTRRLHTLGNLTLVTQKLNGSLSHRPWTDTEATVVAPSGKDAGRGKAWLLEHYSLLVLNKSLVSDHPHAWTDEDIEQRSRELTQRLCAVWPR